MMWPSLIVIAPTGPTPYTEASPGRFFSQDGLRQVRMGEREILGLHGGGPHMNFERLAPNPMKPGKNMITDNLDIFLGN